MSSEPTPIEGIERPARRGWITFGLTGILAIAAAITIGFWGMQGLGEADTEAMESPLMLSVARQLVSSPGELYGPFGGDNPLVLIHAPLYYRLSALVAWPMFRSGLTPATAARIAGRSISFLGLIATMIAAYRIARLAEGSMLAGWWAVLLIAGSPVLAGQPFAVRPDMLGVALQTGGLYLILSAMVHKAGANSRVIWAYAAFGLAICVKQHLFVELIIGTMVLALDRRGSAVRLKTVMRGLAVCLAIVLLDYGIEWVVTGGEIWEAAFVAAGQVSRIYPGGWSHASLILYGLTRRSAGFLVLLPMIGLAIVGGKRGIFGKAFSALGIGLISLILGNLALNLFLKNDSLEVVSFFVSLATGVIFLLCLCFERPILIRDRVDVFLWVCLAGELAVVFLLAYLSTGSWLNYGIQPVVLGAVLLARAGSRVVEALPRARDLWPMGLGVLAILLSSYSQVKNSGLEMRNDQAALAQIFDHLKQPRSAAFFVDRPGLNRLSGRYDLVYDHWLYRAFESAHLAESRSAWIGRALSSRSLHVIVSLSDQAIIEGTSIDLRSLGFRPGGKLGPFFVWVR